MTQIQEEISRICHFDESSYTAIKFLILINSYENIEAVPRAADRRWGFCGQLKGSCISYKKPVSLTIGVSTVRV